MRRNQLRVVGACFVLATATFTTRARSQDYIYTAGPNTVNMSGVACRTAVATEKVDLQYTNAGVRVVTGTKTLYCPVPRRSTTFYGDSSPFNWIQTSGIECIPVSDQFNYNDDGIKNTSTTEAQGVLCPLTTPT